VTKTLEKMSLFPRFSPKIIKIAHILHFIEKIFAYIEKFCTFAADFTSRIVAIATKFVILCVMNILRNEYVERIYAKSWNGKVKIITGLRRSRPPIPRPYRLRLLLHPQRLSATRLLIPSRPNSSATVKS